VSRTKWQRVAPGIYQRGEDSRALTIMIYVPVDLRGPGDGAQRSQAFRGSVPQAIRHKKRLEVELREGRLARSTHMTLGEYVAEWLNTKSDIEVHTRRGYGQDIAHIARFMGSVRLSRLRPAHIRQYVRWCETEGHPNGGRLSPKTMRNRVATLISALKQARRDGYVGPELLGETYLPKKVRRRKMSPLTRSELRTWIQALRGTEFELPVALALLAGLRRGEVSALRRCDVNLRARKLHVRLSRPGWPVAIVVTKPPKTEAGDREVEISDPLAEILARHFAAQDALLPRPPHLDERLVWGHPNGAAFSIDVATRMMPRIGCRYGLRRIRFHDLRHTFATLLLESGVSINKVSALLGHAEVTITVEVYGHVTSLSDKRTREVLDQLADDEDGDPDGGLVPAA
jgi:integrase